MLPKRRRRAAITSRTYNPEMISAYRVNGWVRVVKDGYRINSEVVERGATAARITDVQDWSRWPLTVRKTGQVVEGSTPARRCITADLMLRDGIWVTTTLALAPGTC